MVYTRRALNRLSEEGIEDGVYIDLNGDMGLDHKAIEDKIDGNEANKDEIEIAQAAEFDPVAEASHIIYANEYNFNVIMECIGMFELNEAVSGREAIFSEADTNGLIERAKEFIRKMCEKVALLCKKAILRVASNSKVISNYVSKNKNAIENGASQLGDVGMNNVSVYTLKNLNNFASKLKSTNFRTKKGLIEKLLGSKKQDGDLRSSFLAEMREGEVASTMSVKEYVSKMGGITKITSDVTTSLSSEINSLYKQFEADSNAVIKDLNAQKSSGDTAKITKQLEEAKGAQGIAITAMSAYIDACITYISQNVKAISACRSAYRPDAAQAPKAESAISIGKINII